MKQLPISSSRRLASVIAVALLAPFFALAPATPGSAATCGGSTSQVWVDANCGVTGGGKVPGYDNPLPGTTWVKVQTYPDRVCIDREGNTSYYAWIYGVRPGSPPTDMIYRCLVQHLQTGGAPTLQQAKLLVPTPELKTDFQGDFLTGAPITFSFADPGVLTEEVPNFAAYIQATPTSYEWDFGDGTTSTEANPTHTYLSKNINPERVATVTVTVTYQAVLQVQEADGPVDQDLGEVVVQGTLEKPITEVWSALTREAR